MVLFKATTAALKSSRATTNCTFTLRSEKPALLILMFCSAKAPAALAKTPGWSILEPIIHTIATFSTVTS